jgi:hypothetical protein
MRQSFAFALLLLAAALPSRGQGVDATPASSQSVGRVASGQYQYCTLIYGPNGVPELDYGQNEMPVVTDAEMAKAAAKLRTTRSLVGALNYLSALGWEFLSGTTTTLEARPPEARGFGGGGNPRSVNTSYLNQSTFVLRRRMH